MNPFLSNNNQQVNLTNGQAIISVGEISVTNLTQNKPVRAFNGALINGQIDASSEIFYTGLVDMTSASDLTVPTVSSSDNSNSAASTAFVQSLVSELGGGNMIFTGGSAAGSHCVSTGASGTAYSQSSLNETALAFDFGDKKLTNFGQIENVGDINMHSIGDMNLSADYTLSLLAPVVSAPFIFDVGLVNEKNVYITKDGLTVNNAATGTPSLNVNINGILANSTGNTAGLNSTSLSHNSNSATIDSICSIANDYVNNTLNDINQITSPEINITCPSVVFTEATQISTTPANNLTMLGSNYLNLYGNNIMCNATDNIGINSGTAVNINTTYLNCASSIITTNSTATASAFIKAGGTNLEVLLADGTTAPYNSGGGSSNFYEYKFSDTKTPPPANGQIRFNNSTFSGATHIYIDHLTSNGIDIDFYLDQIGVGDILYIQDKDTSIRYGKYKVITFITYANDYRDFTVSYQSSEGAIFTDNHALIFTNYVDTVSINTRLNALEAKTVYQSAIVGQTNFTGDVMADVLKVNGGSSNSYLMADGSLRPTVQLSNGGLGTSLVKSGTGDVLELNSISAFGGVGLVLNSNNISLSNTLPSTLITFDTSGSGDSLIKTNTNPALVLKGLAVGSGLSISTTTDLITLTNTTMASTLSNAGTGSSLVVSGSAPSLSVKSLSSSTGITINDASNNLEIVNTSPASGITFSSVGTGTVLTSSTTNPNFSVKSLTAGTGINFTGSTSTDLVINSTGGGGGTYTFANAGTGTTLVASTSGATDFKTCSITAGSNVSLSSIGNDITISASGSLGTNTINWTAASANSNYRLGGQALTGAQSIVNYTTTFYFNPSVSNPYGAAALFVPNISLTGQITAPGGFIGNASSATLINTTVTSANTNYDLLGVNGVTPPLAAQRNASFYYNPSVSNPYGASCLFVPNISLTGSITSPSGFVGNASSATTILTAATTANNSFNILGATVASGQTTPSLNSSFYFNPSVTGGQRLFVPNITATTNITAVSFTGLASQATAINTTAVSANTNYNLVGFSSTTGFNGANVNTGFYYNPNTGNPYGAAALFVPNISCAGTITASSFSGSVSSATNLAGGTTASIPYQSAAGTTAFLANGTVNQILTSRGGTLSPAWSSASSLVRGYTVPFSSGGTIAGFQYANAGMVGLTNTAATTGVTTKFICNATGTIEAMSVIWGTGSATATASIIKNTVSIYTTTALFNIAGNTNITGFSFSVAAGDVIEVRTNTANLGNMTVGLYFT